MRGIEARRHVGEHELDRLQPGDRAAEGGALLGVGERVLERRAADAEAPGGHADAAAVEQAERLLEALVLLADRLLDAAVLAGEREVPHAARRGTLVRIQSTIPCVEAPGVKALATPACARTGTSSSGMMPPPKTISSPPPRWRSSSTTAGKRVGCAPERIENASTSRA